MNTCEQFLVFNVDGSSLVSFCFVQQAGLKARTVITNE